MKIIIQEYQQNWPDEFLVHQENILIALNDFNVCIEHIGSTSIPGLGAKPVIDILVGIESADLLDKLILPMQDSGFTYFKKYEPGWPERRLFVRLSPKSNHDIPWIIDINDDDSFRENFITKSNIHIVVKDLYDWKRHIAFRDYLRMHPDTRDKYYMLKKHLSGLDFKDTLAYNDHKNDFIKAIEKRALLWYSEIERKRDSLQK